METIEFSLNNEKKYIIKTYDKFNHTSSITQQKYINTHSFDKHCIESYGNKRGRMLLGSQYFKDVHIHINDLSAMTAGGRK